MTISTTLASDPDNSATGSTNSTTSSRQSTVAVTVRRPRHTRSSRVRSGALAMQITMADSSVPTNGINTATQPPSNNAMMANCKVCL